MLILIICLVDFMFFRGGGLPPERPVAAQRAASPRGVQRVPRRRLHPPRRAGVLDIYVCVYIYIYIYMYIHRQIDTKIDR